MVNETGLQPNKKDIVFDEHLRKDIDICCLQETEIGKIAQVEYVKQ